MPMPRNNRSTQSPAMSVLADKLVQVVEAQLAAREPKEVGMALLRLSFLGQSRGEAIRLIASALVIEMNAAAKTGRDFKRDAYIARLEALAD
jgi:hypothetical protein